MNIQEILSRAPKPHIPKKLPLDNIANLIVQDPEIIKLLGQANSSLGVYSGILMNNVSNPSLLISPLISNEAVLSSKLEGTHATLDDFINFDAGNNVKIEKDEMHEIFNYRKALYYAMDKMSDIKDTNSNKLPLSSRLIKEIHAILLDNVRGSTKSPGKYKTEQNYIGGVNGITFTPLPPDLTDDYMHNLEQYIHNEDEDVILQSALIHVQFEMIHPFKDGNGRIGRLLIPLFLYYRNEIPLPTFYMSEYFESDRSLYLQCLSEVSINNNFIPWIKYYLNGIIAQASKNIIKVNKILELYDDFKKICFDKINSIHAIKALDFIFQHPAVKTKQLSDHLGVSQKTALSLLKNFSELGILTHNDVKRNITFYCNSIINSIR
ncbi:MAG: Fic family protein [Clostridiales bacterium]|nr:Fic family protein [Clostridiales bacterium]MBS5877276.1 Fic family protein [Clostridiales bacterium]